MHSKDEMRRKYLARKPKRQGDLGIDWRWATGSIPTATQGGFFSIHDRAVYRGRQHRKGKKADVALWCPMSA
jgi:hypothetical protein